MKTETRMKLKLSLHFLLLELVSGEADHGYLIIFE